MDTCHCNHHNPHQTLTDALDEARREQPAWFALFEDSNLSVPRSADEQLALDLALTAPSPLLRGYVMGLFINN